MEGATKHTKLIQTHKESSTYVLLYSLGLITATLHAHFSQWQSFQTHSPP